MPNPTPQHLVYRVGNMNTAVSSQHSGETGLVVSTDTAGLDAEC